jgi:hypothetical protein
MRLKLRELQEVVNKTLMEERDVDALREEVSNVLGPSVVTDVKLEALAEGVNDRIDVLERTGRANRIAFKPALMLKFADSQSAEVRRMAARTLPEQFLSRFKLDRDPAVRHAVARRTSLSIVKEMARRSPNDDELQQIYRERLVAESGVPTPKIADEPFDMYGKKLGAAVKQPAGPELSDQWYSMMAHKAISDYHHNIEGMWDEAWAHRICASMKATSGVDVDQKKLWDEIQRQLTDRDDRTLERYSLKEVARRLYESAGDEAEIWQESIDPVEELMGSSLSTSEFLREAAVIFNIQEATIPRSLQKYRFSEGHRLAMKVPCKARVPGGRGVTSLVERALDMYTKRWNEAQAQSDEPIRINWSLNPSAVGVITFKMELK